MSEIKVKIDAPELAQAILTLAAALSQSTSTVQPQIVAPVQQQQATMQQTPTQAQQMQTPVQQAPMQQQPYQYSAPVQNAQQAQQPQQQPPIGVPTTAPSYTSDQLALAASQLVDAGRMNEIRGLIAQFGVQALTMLPPDQYGAFATALRQLGAKI